MGGSSNSCLVGSPSHQNPNHRFPFDVRFCVSMSKVAGIGTTHGLKRNGWHENSGGFSLEFGPLTADS